MQAPDTCQPKSRAWLEAAVEAPVVVALRGAGEPSLLADEDVHWLPIGQVEALLAHFRSRGVGEAVLAGKVPKTLLFGGRAGDAERSGGIDALELDARAIALLSALPDRRDDSILGAIADTLADEGVRLTPQVEWADGLLPGVGPQASVKPSDQEWLDVRFGWAIAKAIAGLDVGQTVVVKKQAVLAIEAIEGTDAAIARAGALGGEGGVVIKVAKPNQDPRFDVPAIGAATIEGMRGSGARLLAYEAGETLLLERDRVLREADAAGIAIVGVPPGGPE